MKIALVFPRMRYGEHSPPLGLGYLAAVLERAGHSAEIIDMTFEKDFSHLEERLKKFLPELVGITCQTTFAEDVFKAAKIAKQILKSVLVVIGGPHPTIRPKESLEESESDISVIGEGEDCLLEIIESIESGKSYDHIKGICYKQEQSAICTQSRSFIEDLDTIPFPARHLFDKRYFDFPEITMISSRGCSDHDKR